MNPQPPPNRVSLNTLIQFVVHESHTSLTNLAKQLSSSQQSSLSSSSSSQDRKQLIHDYLQATQERFMRLLVLLRWVKLHKSEFDEYDEFVSSMINITSAMQYTANELFQLDQQVKNVRIPVYDLPTAINVMTTGTVNLLPSAIQQAESIFSQEQRNASGFDQSSAIQRLNDLIRMKLLQSSIPDAIQVTKIDNGQVVLSVPNQFLLILTLKYDVNYYDQLQLRQNTTTTTTTGTTTSTTTSHDHDHDTMMTDHEDNNELSAPHDTDDNDDEKKQREKMLLLIEQEKEKKNAFMWHITHLQFFVNESGVTVNPLVYHSWMRLKRVLQARLDNRMDSEPLVDLYHRLHSVAVRLVADIMSKQGHQLQYNQWKNCSIMYDIFNEHIVDDEIPFMIKYWQGAPNVNRLITDSTVSAAQWTRLAKFSLNTSHFMDDSSALGGAVESSTATTTAATTVQQQQKKNQYAGELRFYVNSERNFVVEHRSNLSLISSSGGMKTQYSLNWAQMDLSQIVSTAMHHHIDSIMQIVYEFLRNEPNFHIPISLLTSHTPGSPSILRAQLFEKYSLDVTIDWRNGKFQLSVNKDNFSVNTTGLDGFKKMHDMINKYDESKLKQPFGSVLVQAIENIRMLVIIHAYTHASKLLGLDTFHFLPGVHREREQKSNHMLFIRAPTCPSAFISIKANTSQKMRKPVSCRIILQVSPKLVERKITDFMTQKQNGYHYQTYHQQNGHSDSSTIVDDHPNTTHHHYHKSGHLAAMKHLKMIIDQCQTSIERYLIVSELEARDGINFQII